MPERQGDDADRRWAAEQAPRLLAKARSEALEEAHRRLRGRLVDALMSAATAQGGEPPVRAPEEPPAGGQARAPAQPPARSAPE
jgi:hypothetical protein